MIRGRGPFPVWMIRSYITIWNRNFKTIKLNGSVAWSELKYNSYQYGLEFAIDENERTNLAKVHRFTFKGKTIQMCWNKNLVISWLSPLPNLFRKDMQIYTLQGSAKWLNELYSFSGLRNLSTHNQFMKIDFIKLSPWTSFSFLQVDTKTPG